MSGMARLYKKYGRFSGYFKKSEEYVEKSKSKKEELSHEEEEAQNKEDRYCLHWGCEKVFKKLDNVGKKPCVFHPGKISI